MARVEAWGLIPRLLAHVADTKRSPLLNEDEIHDLRADLVSFLKNSGWHCSATIAEGQPFTLEVWDALLRRIQDCDTELPEILQRGTLTGILADLPASGVWRAVDRPSARLWISWCMMSLTRLVQAHVDAGFAAWLPGGMTEARARLELAVLWANWA